MAVDGREFSRMVRVLRGDVPGARTRAEARQLAPIPNHLFEGRIEAWNGWRDGKKDHRGPNEAGGIGSQNHPLHAAAAAGWWKWIVDYCRFELENGIRGREQGSPEYYHAGPVAAVMTALALARKEGDDAAERDVSRWLRALWTLDALCATVPEGPGPGRQIKELFQRPPVLEPKVRPMRQDYLGPVVVMPGMRWRQDELGRPSSRDWLFAWAMDMPRKYPRLQGQIQRPNDHAYYPQVFAEIADVAGIQSPTPAEIWGLTDAERQVLRQIVAGDVDAVESALGYLDGLVPIYLRFQKGIADPQRSQRLRVRRFADGSVESYTHRAINGNKPGVQAAQFRAGRAERLIAAAVDGTTRDGQNKGWRVRIDEDSHLVHLSGTSFGRYDGPFRGVDFDLPMLSGELLWDLEITAEGVVVHGLEGGSTPGPGPAPYPGWESEVDRAYVAISRALPDLTTGPALANFVEVLDRVRFLERGQSHPRGKASTGARTLIDTLEPLEEDSSSPATPPGPWENEIETAVGAIGRAMPGRRVRGALAVIGEVLDRIRSLELKQSHPRGKASTGARSLVNVLEGLE